NQLSFIKIMRQFLAHHSAAGLAGAFGERAQPQGVELDEARCVAMVISARAFLEGHEILVIEGVSARTANDESRALEKFQTHPAGDELLATVNEGLQHFALRRKPKSIVDDLGIFWHQLVLEMRGTAIERDLLNPAMRVIKDRAAGRLIHAA